MAQRALDRHWVSAVAHLGTIETIVDVFYGTGLNELEIWCETKRKNGFMIRFFLLDGGNNVPTTDENHALQHLRINE